MNEDKLIIDIAEILKKKSLVVSTAESCTGGLVSSLLTDISGSSAFIMQNFVTYSNNAKNLLLGVSKETLEKYGAVSEEVAIEMAKGVLQYGADIGVSTTGVAGPTGGTEENPVGTMWTCIANKNSFICNKAIFDKSINRVILKRKFAIFALELLLQFLTTNLHR